MFEYQKGEKMDDRLHRIDTMPDEEWAKGHQERMARIELRIKEIVVMYTPKGGGDGKTNKN